MHNNHEEGGRMKLRAPYGSGIRRPLLKGRLRRVTQCTIQGPELYGGWTCGSCFFYASKRLENIHWQAVLAYRGDYDLETMDYEVAELQDALREVWEIFGQGPFEG